VRRAFASSALYAVFLALIMCLACAAFSFPPAFSIFGSFAVGESYRSDFYGVDTSGLDEGQRLVKESVALNFRNSEGKARYTLYNDNGASGHAKIEFLFFGGPYDGNRCAVTSDDGDLQYNIVYGRNEEKRGEKSVLINENAEYPLYIINVNRNFANRNDIKKVYICADFIVDMSRTRIVADGFGYAANRYGAVRVWSRSDGFDQGFDRRIYVVGDDVPLDFKAYEDDGFTAQTDLIDITVTKRPISVRDYLLEFSGPSRLSSATLLEQRGEPMNDPRFKDSLYSLYVSEMERLFDIHYFLPRNYIYENAEKSRICAIQFYVDVPAASSRSFEVMFPAGLYAKSSSLTEPERYAMGPAESEAKRDYVQSADMTIIAPDFLKNAKITINTARGDDTGGFSAVFERSGRSASLPRFARAAFFACAVLCFAALPARHLVSR